MKQIYKHFSTYITLLLMTITIGSAVLPVVASAAPVSTFGATSSGPQFTLLPPWYKNLEDGNGGITPPNKFSGGLRAWLTQIALNIIEALFYVVGYVSLGFIIWGGFKFMINGNESSGVVSARKTIQNAVIGLIISIFAVAIVNLVSSTFNV